VDAGAGSQTPPRPGEGFTLLLRLKSDGSPELLKFLDAPFSGDLSAGSNGTTYLVLGNPSRAFYFDPPGRER
jgi:hypothetical protein